MSKQKHDIGRKKREKAAKLQLRLEILSKRKRLESRPAQPASPYGRISNIPKNPGNKGRK